MKHFVQNVYGIEYLFRKVTCSNILTYFQIFFPWKEWLTARNFKLLQKSWNKIIIKTLVKGEEFAPKNEFHHPSKPDAAQTFIMKEKFVGLYHPFDNYKFPKRIFREAERPWQSSWFKAYGWLCRVTGKDAMIFYICVNQDLNGYLRSEVGGGGGGAAAGPGRGIWGGVRESGDWKLDGARGLWYLRLLTVWLLLLLR